ncbi:hypothetical protein P152DRAFT_494455 [Eremomyces bilateralis CBS 781.70]|uniref:Uncharacterized protein n=1 Tax=Eremomyces bilateralis CBS 781.70 TaxID=1392243 RepID=A0A6G1FV19_9PEZI|nr:uncharacterized protein P152DRAFT_494455 [Eremomyces bilateralis CBS 781.70]KAF1809501.1 hypothetical protein P152DRAFT_494455 [Eremomyces bilateralis CBS 781.70]
MQTTSFRESPLTAFIVLIMMDSLSTVLYRTITRKRNPYVSKPTSSTDTMTRFNSFDTAALPQEDYYEACDLSRYFANLPDLAYSTHANPTCDSDVIARSGRADSPTLGYDNSLPPRHRGIHEPKLSRATWIAGIETVLRPVEDAQKRALLEEALYTLAPREKMDRREAPRREERQTLERREEGWKRPSDAHSGHSVGSSGGLGGLLRNWRRKPPVNKTGSFRKSQQSVPPLHHHQRPSSPLSPPVSATETALTPTPLQPPRYESIEDKLRRKATEFSKLHTAEDDAYAEHLHHLTTENPPSSILSNFLTLRLHLQASCVPQHDALLAAVDDIDASLATAGECAEAAEMLARRIEAWMAVERDAEMLVDSGTVVDFVGKVGRVWEMVGRVREGVGGMEGGMREVREGAEEMVAQVQEARYAVAVAQMGR